MKDNERVDQPASDVTSKLSFRENVLYTIAILGAMGLVGAALWAVGLWTSSS